MSAPGEILDPQPTPPAASAPQGLATLTDATFATHLAPGSLVLAAILGDVTPPVVRPPFRYALVGARDRRLAALLAAAHPTATVIDLAVDDGEVRPPAPPRPTDGPANLTSLTVPAATLAEAARDLEPCQFVAIPTLFGRSGEADRRRLVDAARRLVAPGGLLQVGYPCLPGALPLVDVQHLARATDTDADPAERVARAADTLHLASAAGARRLVGNPWRAALGAATQGHNVAAVIETLLETRWRPCWHPDVVRSFGDGGFRLIGPARLVPDGPRIPELPVAASGEDGRDAGGRPGALADQAPTDQALRGALDDLVRARPLRSDLFGRGAPPLDRETRRQMIERQRLALVVPPPAAARRLGQSAGLPGDESAFRPLVAALAAGPRRLGELSAFLPLPTRQIPADRLLRVLLAAGIVQPALERDTPIRATMLHRTNLALARAAVEADLDAPGLIAGATTGGLLALSAPVHLCFLALASGIAPLGDAVAAHVDAWYRRRGRPTAGGAIDAAQIGRVVSDLYPVWRRLDVL